MLLLELYIILLFLCCVRCFCCVCYWCCSSWCWCCYCCSWYCWHHCCCSCCLYTCFYCFWYNVALLRLLLVMFVCKYMSLLLSFSLLLLLLLLPMLLCCVGNIKHLGGWILGREHRAWAHNLLRSEEHWARIRSLKSTKEVCTVKWGRLVLKMECLEVILFVGLFKLPDLSLINTHYTVLFPKSNYPVCMWPFCNTLCCADLLHSWAW